MKKKGKRKSGPWYSEERERVFFERNATDYYPKLQREYRQLDGEGRGCMYTVYVDVPHYETRRHVRIFFRESGKGDIPIILTDGPTDSPHRFGDFGRRQLCVWYQKDPQEMRWARADGLLHLLGLIKWHLFREEWWRETGRGEWLGMEVSHGASTPEAGP